MDSGLTCGVLSEACGEHVTHDHFADLINANARAFHRLRDHDGAELRGSDIFQGPAELADSSPHRTNDNNLFSHGFSSKTKYITFQDSSFLLMEPLVEEDDI
jgi:hypothetical protein